MVQSTVSAFIKSVLSFVRAVFSFMVFCTESADLGRVVLQCTVGFHMSELLTSIALSYVDSISYPASTEVNKNLKLKRLDGFILRWIIIV